MSEAKHIETEIVDNDETNEPFDTVCDLMDEYGAKELLRIISVLSECAADDPDNCLDCREQSARVHLSLENLLAELELLAIINAWRLALYAGSGDHPEVHAEAEGGAAV